MNQGRLILDYALEHAARQPGRIYLTQPVGGGRVVDYTWGEVVDQASRMAAHLHSGGLEPGARVVTTGAFLLKSDVLRSKMGAGCAD